MKTKSPASVPATAPCRPRAVASGGVEDGDRSRAGNQLEHQHGEDEARVVLDVEHRRRSARSALRVERVAQAVAEQV